MRICRERAKKVGPAILAALVCLAAGGCSTGPIGAPKATVPAEDWNIADPGAANPNGVFFIDVRHGVVTATASSGFVFGGAKVSPISWTDDSGQNWHEAKLDFDADSASSPWFLNFSKGWAVGHATDGSQLLKTEDGGRSWYRQTLPEGIKAGAVWFDTTGQTGWMRSADGFYRTTNGGTDWSKIHLPNNFGLWAHHVVNDKSLLLAGGRAGQAIIARTDDGGVNWRETSIALEGGSLGAVHLARDGQRGWAVGMEGRRIVHGGWVQHEQPVILRTDDGGAVWQRQQAQGVRTPLTDVWAVSGTEAWISTFGGYALPTFVPAKLLHTSDGGRTWSDETPACFSLRKLFFLDAMHGWAVGGQGGSPYESARVILIYAPGE